MTLSKWLFHYLLLWDGNHTIHCTNFSLTKGFSSTKSSWISLEVWPVVCYSMYKVDIVVDFICILRIIWWSKSSRVEGGIYLTFTICPNPQFFFHNTIYYWFISNGSGSNFALTIIDSYFLPELLLTLSYICGLPFYLSFKFIYLLLYWSTIVLLLLFSLPFYLCLFEQFWCVLSWFCLFCLI